MGLASAHAHAPVALAEIWAYTATTASEEVASRFVTAIEAAFEPVRYFPAADPDAPQGAAVLVPVKDASRRLRRSPAAILDLLSAR